MDLIYRIVIDLGPDADFSIFLPRDEAPKSGCTGGAAISPVKPMGRNTACGAPSGWKPILVGGTA